VEAEEQLQKTPALLKAPSGYVQQSPWLSVANKQLELMGRYMSELGLTPSARTRLGIGDAASAHHPVTTIKVVTGVPDDDDDFSERPVDMMDSARRKDGKDSDVARGVG
jgi:phage terminase small subunit